MFDDIQLIFGLLVLAGIVIVLLSDASDKQQQIKEIKRQRKIEISDSYTQPDTECHSVLSYRTDLDGYDLNKGRWIVDVNDFVSFAESESNFDNKYTRSLINWMKAHNDDPDPTELTRIEEQLSGWSLEIMIEMFEAGRLQIYCESCKRSFLKDEVSTQRDNAIDGLGIDVVYGTSFCPSGHRLRTFYIDQDVDRIY